MYDTTNYGYSRSLSSIMYKAYAWMTAGLGITTLTSYYVASTPSLYPLIFGSKLVFFGLMALQLGLVWFLSANIQRLSFSTAIVMFLSYAALLGVSLSMVLLLYDVHSLFFVLFVTAAMFAVMALYGYFTQDDLTSVGSFFSMAFVGLIVGMFANIFFKNPFFDLLLAYLGVIIFIGLVAYDVQKIKMLALQFRNDEESSNKVALLGALTLYLDFVNLFLHL